MALNILFSHVCHQMMSVPGQTVEELVHHWSQVDSDTEAFISISATHERRSITRHELNTLVRKFAALLRQFGVGKGDVVCVAMGNCLERVIVDLGIICSGAVALNGQVFRKDGEDFIQVICLKHCMVWSFMNNDKIHLAHVSCVWKLSVTLYDLLHILSSCFRVDSIYCSSASQCVLACVWLSWLPCVWC